MTSSSGHLLGQVTDYEIRQLRVFKSVVECGGFTAAETELNIGRSTISLHIGKLEERLNLRLCRRGRAGFALTEEGLAVYQATLDLLGAMETFRGRVGSLLEQPSGELRIIASDTVSLDQRSGVSATVATFARQAPGVHLRLDVGIMNEIERMVLQEEADLGLVPHHREVEGLDYVPLYSETCYLYCSRDHPLAGTRDSGALLAALPDHPVVHAGIPVNDAVGKQLAGLRLGATAYYYETRLALILSGAYLGFLPDEFASTWLASGALRRLAPEHKHYRLGVASVTKRHARTNRARELFSALLVEHYARPRPHLDEEDSRRDH
ncbi:MAG: LysR family transcriptional regulator [Gammaproteobacteria bacterium]|nr:LysR family transcriptional regulator [Gammaproteobacteria bacterium]